MEETIKKRLKQIEAEQPKEFRKLFCEKDN